MTFDELVAQHGSPEAIPHRVLYDFILDPALRKHLAGMVQSWREKVAKADDPKEEPNREFWLKTAASELENLKSYPAVAEVRRRAKRDLCFLVCYFTWETNPECLGNPIEESRITESSHDPIFDFFVKKDDSKKLRDQDSLKLRLLLWPRGGMKSTIDVVDTVQWIINFPEIRILFLTGDDDLAVGFVKETKGHFLIKSDELTSMNLFFPEFCFEEKEIGNSYEFNNPLWLAKRVLRKEPTVQASSVGSGLGGRHYEVIKADDAVYDRNSETEESCAKVTKKISLTSRQGKMLRVWGYFDAVGTRYHDEDYYGYVIQNNEITEKTATDIVTKSGKCWTLIENKKTHQRILIGRAIVIKPEVAEALAKEGKPVNYMEAGEEGCDLLFPEIMPYGFLMGEYADNEEIFEGQLNQNPRSNSATTFDRPLLLRNTVRFDEMPYTGPISQTWDFAGPFNVMKRGDRDFCTASSAVWNLQGQCFIQEIIRKRFKPHDLAKAVVDFAAKYMPFTIGIEDTVGSRWLEPQIWHEADKTGNPHVIRVCRAIQWIEQDNQKGAKKLRMAALHPWLVDGRLKFANYAMAQSGGMEILYNEFERCLHSPRHDDIPDVISHQPRFAPRMAQAIAKPENAGMPPMSMQTAMYNILYGPWLTENEVGADAFGRLGMAPPPPVVETEPEPEVKAEAPPGLHPVLGAGLYG